MMKMQTISVENFGHFQKYNVHVESGLNIFLGPNEAGKSTLAQFISYVLFEPPKRYNGFIKGANDSGHLAFANGVTVERIQRSLTRTPSIQSEDQLLRRLGVSREIFDSVFSFSLDELTRYSELQAEDAFTGALTGAYPLIKDARRVLADRREKIWTMRSRTRELDELNNQMNALVGQIDAARRKLGKFTEYEHELEQLESRRLSKREEAQDASRAARRWENINKAYETFTKLEELRFRLKELPSERNLPPRFGDEARAFHAEIETLEGRLLGRRDDAERSKRELDENAYASTLYERRHDIELWLRQLEQLKDVSIPERSQALREAEVAYLKACEEAGISPQTSVAPLSQPERKRIFEAARDALAYRGWQAEHGKARHDHEAATERYRELVVERDAMPRDRAAEGVENAIEALARDSAERQKDKDELTRLDREIDDLTSELARNPLPQGFQPLDADRAEDLKREAEVLRDARRDAGERVRTVSAHTDAIVVPEVLARLTTDELQKLGKSLRSEASHFQAAIKNRDESAREVARLRAEILQYVALLGADFTPEVIATIDLSPARAGAIASAESAWEEARSEVRDVRRGLGDAPREYSTKDLDEARGRVAELKALEKTLVETSTGHSTLRLPGWFFALRWLAPIAFIVMGVILFATGIVWAGVVLALLAIGLLVALMSLQRTLEAPESTSSTGDATDAMKALGLKPTASVLEVRAELERASDDVQEISAGKEKYEAWKELDARLAVASSSSAKAEAEWRNELLLSRIPGADGIQMDVWKKAKTPFENIQALQVQRNARTRELTETEEKVAVFQTRFAPLARAFDVELVTQEDVLDAGNLISQELEAVEKRALALEDQSRALDELREAQGELAKTELDIRKFVDKWHGLSLPSTEIEEVRSVLDRLERAWQNSLQLKRNEEARARVIARLEAFENSLRAALEPLGVEPRLDNLKVAQSRVERALRDRKSWEEFDEKVQRVRATMEAASEALEKLEDEERRGQVPRDHWADILAEFPLLVNASPDGAEGALNLWAATYNAWHQKGESEKQHKAVLANYDIISDGLRAIHADLGDGSEFEFWRAKLSATMEETVRCATVSERAADELTRGLNDIQHIESKLRDTRSSLEALLDEVGASDFEEACRLIEVESQRVELTNAIAEVEGTLKVTLGAEWADPRTKEALETGDVAGWAAASEQCRKDAEEFQRQADKAIAEYARLETEFEELKESGVLADLMVEEASLGAQILKLQEEYTEVVIALHLLERAVQMFKDEHQPAVMDVANEFVQKATSGLYAGLEISDDGKQIFLRDSTGRYRAEDGLSRGTRELIFIILRLALATDYTLNRGSCAPLVMDDILVNQDDERMEQIGRLIVEASRYLQILFFTCRPETEALLKRIASEAALRGEDTPAPLTIPMERYNGHERPVVGLAEVQGLSIPTDEEEPDLSRQIYDLLRASDEELSRGEILERLQLDDDSGWNGAIKELKDKGFVEQVGEKRGARYRSA